MATTPINPYAGLSRQVMHQHPPMSGQTVLRNTSTQPVNVAGSQRHHLGTLHPGHIVTLQVGAGGLVQNAIQSLSNSAGGNSWGNHPNQGNFGGGGGNLGNSGGNGLGNYGGGTVFTSTQGGTYATSLVGTGGAGSYQPPPMSPRDFAHAIARYDGIMEAYWWALIEGLSLPFVQGSELYDQAREYVGVLRNPQPAVWISAEDRQQHAINPPQWLVAYWEIIERERQEEADARAAERLAKYQKHALGTLGQAQASQQGFWGKIFGAPSP